MGDKIFATTIDQSFLIGVGDNIPARLDSNEILQKLKGNKEFSDVRVTDGLYMDQENMRFHHYELKYKEKDYRVTVRIYNIVPEELESLIPKFQYLNRADKAFYERINKGIEVLIYFDGDVDRCYELQFKALDTIYPEYRMVIDINSTCIFNKHWVKGFVNDRVKLDNEYRYNIHAVDMGDGVVRLHSHGLLRYGLREIQVCGDKEYIERYYTIMRVVIERLLKYDIYTYNQCGEMIQFIEPLTLVEVEEMNELCNNNEDYHLEIKKYIDDETYDDLEEIEGFEQIPPLRMITLGDTLEMRGKALKTLFAFEKYYKKYDGIIKFAIPYDLDFDNLDFGRAEYMWFEDIKIKENGDFEGRLINEPIRIEKDKRLHAGKRLTLPKKALVDWNLKLDGETIESNDWIILEGEDSEKEDNSFFNKIKRLFKK